MMLVNVLAIVAVAAAALVLMAGAQDAGLSRATRLADAARLAAIADAGELSAVVALRRDARDAPRSDHAREPWAAASQRETAIADGRFRLTIADAQGRFNVNTLATGGLVALELFGRLATAAGVPRDVADRAATFAQLAGPLPSLAALAGAGIDARALARLEPLMTALPVPTPINLNAAPEPLLAILFADPLAARMLAARRARAGFLTAEDLVSARVVAPPGSGFTSDHFWVATEVTLGGGRQRLVSLVARWREKGEARAGAVARWRATGVERG